MERMTVDQAQKALDAAWETHQAALDSGKVRAINKASNAVRDAALALMKAKRHAVMDRDIATRK